MWRKIMAQSYKTNTIQVDTQGISDDWTTANGVFDPVSRGDLDMDQVLSAMQCLAPLDTPDTDDPCPPHVQTKGPAGNFSFVGQGGTIYCTDVDQFMTPRQAAKVAFGARSVAPPPPPKPHIRPSGGPVTPPQMKHRYGWRGRILMLIAFGFLFATFVAVVNGMAVLESGGSTDDFLAAMVTGGGLGVSTFILWAAARRARQTYYVDESGAQVDADGTALQYMMMGQMVGTFDSDDDGGDSDGGDFD